MKLRYGQASDNVLDRSVYKRLGKTLDLEQKKGSTGSGPESEPALRSAPDQAEAWRDRNHMNMSSVCLPCQDVGYLSVVAAVNNLAADGRRANRIRTAILLPEGSEEDLLRSLEDQIREAAEQTGVVVGGGHTEVTAAVSRPVVMTAAEGPAFRTGEAGGSNEAPWHILIAGAVGAEGTCILAKEKYKELSRRFPAGFLDRAVRMREKLSVVQAAEQICRHRGGSTAAVPVMVNASDGGIFAALWNFSRKAGRVLGLPGFRIGLLKIPIGQETIEISDFFQMNPYEMASEGSLIAAVQDPETLIDTLTREGIPAADVGVLWADRNKCLYNDEEVRFLDAPAADALLTVLR